MQLNVNIKKAVALCLLIAMLFAVLAPVSLSADETTITASDDADEEPAEKADEEKESKDYDQELANLNKDKDKLQQELSKLENDIKDLQSDKKQNQADKNNVSQQITTTQKLLQVLEDEIKVLDEKIAAKEQEIADAQASIDHNYEMFKKRIRAMYMSNNTSVINVIFGAETFSEFLERTEYSKRISDHDDKLIKDLRADKKAIEEAKAEIDAAKEEKLGTQSEAKKTEQNLNSKYDKLSVEEALLKKTEAAFNKNKKELQEEMKRLDKEIEKIILANAENGEYVGGDFMWPVKGYNSISSYYGWRFNNTDFHTGIDITGSGIYGQPIRAANAGKVIFVQTTYTAGKGYGMYVIIDHGGGRSTLYGHMSAVSVSLGDWVSQGDKIGEVGSTGWSTGPHLHFEIRLNGKHTNPMNYFSKKS